MPVWSTETTEDTANTESRVHADRAAGLRRRRAAVRTRAGRRPVMRRAASRTSGVRGTGGEGVAGWRPLLGRRRKHSFPLVLSGRAAPVALGTMLIAVVAAAPAPAAVFTVGPSGAYASLGDAIAAASGVPGSHEIKVAAGVYVETPLVSVPDGQSLRITGGWNGTYTARSLDPAATTIDGAGIDRVLHLQGAGETQLDGFHITGGFLSGSPVPPDDSFSAGIVVSGSGAGHVVLRRLLIDGNVLESNGKGASALFAVMSGASRLEIIDATIARNTHVSTSGLDFAYGAVALFASHEAQLSMRDSRIEDNHSSTALRLAGGGLALSVIDTARAAVLDTLVRDNTADPGAAPFSTTGAYVAVGSLSGSPDCADCRPSLEMRRIRIWDNHAPGAENTGQVHVQVAESGWMLLSDSIVAGDSGNGLDLLTFQQGTLDAVNLTVADHDGIGVRAAVGGADSMIALANIIAFGNGTNLLPAGPVTLDTNLVGVDPRFADAIGRDYSLRPGSPAIDAGDPSPEGGLGPADVALGPRVVGPRVDIGAYEADAGGGFCRVTGPPISSIAPVCRCLSHEDLRELRCAFITRDVILRLFAPLPPQPASPAIFTLDAWGGIDGQWQLESTLEHDGQLEPAGMATGFFNDNKERKAKLSLPAVQTGDLLTTLLRYVPKGEQQPVELRLEVAMGDPSASQPQN